VNEKRVEYLISLIEKQKFRLYSQEALAKEAGFASRQSMNYTFSKIKGQIFSSFLNS
jgi:hypothetical protein